MNILPIGSVIRKNGIDLIIMGYNMSEEESSYRFYYNVSLFPVGYQPSHDKSIACIDIEGDYEFLFKGYCDKYGDMYIDEIASRIKILANVDPKTINSVLKDAAKRMEADK